MKTSNFSVIKKTAKEQASPQPLNKTLGERGKGGEGKGGEERGERKRRVPERAAEHQESSRLRDRTSSCH